MKNNLEKLTELFKVFPGIGARQAKRFVYFLIKSNPSYVAALIKEIQDVRSGSRQCESCYRYFESSTKIVCDRCSDPKTDVSTILVVEKDSDLEPIERSRVYKGLFFVLGGLIPIAQKSVLEYLHIEPLLKKITTDSPKEIILAFAANPHGEYTDLYLREKISPLAPTLKISTLGRGLSTGTELEYIDTDTIKNALANRG